MVPSSPKVTSVPWSLHVTLQTDICLLHKLCSYWRASNTRLKQQQYKKPKH
jgi:hypothetical protein